MTRPLSPARLGSSASALVPLSDGEPFPALSTTLAAPVCVEESLALGEHPRANSTVHLMGSPRRSLYCPPLPVAPSQPVLSARTGYTKTSAPRMEDLYG